MPVDLRTKDQLKAYAFYSAGIKHMAANFFDIIYDALSTRLSHEQKIEILKKIIKWWASPEYLEVIRNDSSPNSVARICKRQAKKLEEEYLRTIGGSNADNPGLE